MMEAMKITKGIKAIPSIRYGAQQMSVFQLFGVLGFLLGTAGAVFLAGHLGLSITVVISLALGSLLVFFAVVKVRELIWRDDSLVYYHHHVIVIGIAAIVCALLGHPIYPYLDIVALGLGICLMVGRIGCAMAGCCHGLPAVWGMHYQLLRLYVGLPRAYKGVLIFPVQLAESLGVAVVLLLGVLVLQSSATAGTLFVLYLAGYGCLRFFLEFYRGDADRPFRMGLSQAQVFSVVILWLLLWPAYQVDARLGLFCLLAALVLTLLAVAVAVRYVQDPRAALLLSAGHLIEIAEIARYFCADRIHRTSQGVNMSFALSDFTETRVFVLTLSDLSCKRGRYVADRLAKFVFRVNRITSYRAQDAGSNNGIYQYWGHLTAN